MAKIVITTLANEHRVKVTETNRAIILEQVTEITLLRKIVANLNILYLFACLYHDVGDFERFWWN